MSEKADSSEKPTRSSGRGKIAGLGLLVVVVAVVAMRLHRVDDGALEQALIGTWTAVDPSDASLHRRELPVAFEQLVIRPDKTITHVVELASKPGHPDRDPWGWKVHKGRLYVRFRGEDASGQWLPGFSFSVTDHTLSIHIKDHPPKTWTRVEGQEKREHATDADHGN